ncbi:MAG: electron transfer flavoprotein subunit beta [Phycisphaerae bacterium]|nr:MAG: electron transfer flavoprotein subunit beta/FixA family protein [Planctomycetia bacterium]RIK69764.1 MAG: electron transfer flavoprotein subunit beta [Planctomycetota bacterium]GJQ26132.1 MAG: electron transfer flavoprotein subunit beta [Phycisphaerae bacterium]
MKVLVLAKYVPESTANIKVKADGSGIETAGVKFVMNPFCEFAVEAALQFKEKNPGAGVEITVLTLGPAAAVDVIRTAYAMGADHGIHLCDDAFNHLDELTSARVIAAAIKDGGYELIFAGKHAIDYDSGQLGPALAELLGWPHVGAVTAIEWGNGFKSATVRRRIEGAEEVVQVQLPALLTIEKGLCEPRYPSLPGLMKAKKRPVDTKNAAALGLAAADLSADAVGTRMGEFAPPPPRPPGRKLSGEPADMARELVRILREEEKLI